VHQVVSWEPGLTFTVEEIAAAYDVDLTLRVIPFHTARTEARPGAKGVLSRLSAAGLYLGRISGRPGAHRISCPWIHLHTDRDDTGTAYFEPGPANSWSGGFRCHHGHCEHHDIRSLIRFLHIYEQIGKENAGHG
jgi:hypothetical protein